MSLISMISSMSSMVSQIGPGFKAAGTMAIAAFKSVIKWFKDNLITPMKEKLDAISWDSIKTKAEEAWTAIKTKTDEVLGALWDLLPAMPDELTYAYWFGEGGVFDWSIDWDGLFKFTLRKELTYDHWFGEGGVFDWSIDYDAFFKFTLPDELTYDHYFGEDGVFDWSIDYDALFKFTLPNELTYDHYFGEKGVFDWDINWSGLFDFTLPDKLTYAYWFGEGGVFDWNLSSLFDFNAWTDLLPDWSWSDIIPDNLKDFFSMDTLETTFTGITDAIGSLAGTLIEPVRTGINDLLIDNLNSITGYDLPAIGSIRSITGFSKIPHLAKGGIINKPTLAMVGEDGPEAVVPLTQRNNPSGAGMGGGTVNVTVNASGITDRSDKRALAREIGNMIQQEMARNIGGTTMRGRY